MKQVGYELKSGKHLAFKSAEQNKFIRLRSLGDGYSEEEIKAIISGMPKPVTSTPHTARQAIQEGFMRNTPPI